MEASKASIHGRHAGTAGQSTDIGSSRALSPRHPQARVPRASASIATARDLQPRGKYHRRYNNRRALRPNRRGGGNSRRVDVAGQEARADPEGAVVVLQEFRNQSEICRRLGYSLYESFLHIGNSSQQPVKF